MDIFEVVCDGIQGLASGRIAVMFIIVCYDIDLVWRNVGFR